MKTTQTRHYPARDSEKNALVVRLERNQRDLIQLRKKLNSYRCEPKTYILFEQMDTLRRGMDSLSNANREIIKALRERKRTVDDYVDHVKKQYSEFKKLHDSVEDYLRECLDPYDTSYS